MTYLKKDELESISVISKENIFDENSNSSFHTAYQAERLFYNCIKNGDYEKAKSTIDTLLSRTIITGRLSDDEIRQTKYFAVCCITLATRYAITGGLGEETAYNFSDSAIYETDKMQNIKDILFFLKGRCLTLTKMVKEEKEKHYDLHIRKCIAYINRNLHNRLTVEILASECSLSPDYLSSHFKKITSQTLSAYILEMRLKYASDLLLKGNKASDVAYYLNFCSESYFIKCFREKYGVTPKKYVNANIVT